MRAIKHTWDNPFDVRSSFFYGFVIVIWRVPLEYGGSFAAYSVIESTSKAILRSIVRCFVN